MTLDCIHLDNIRAYGYTGFLPEEQRLGQWFQVDLSLWLNLSSAGQTDDIALTYDYRNCVQAIQELIQTSQFLLIERLADAIAQLALEKGSAQRVRVKLTKLSPPIPNFGGTVAIEIYRPS